MAKHQQFMLSFTTIIRGTLVVKVQLKCYALPTAFRHHIPDLEGIIYTNIRLSLYKNGNYTDC